MIELVDEDEKLKCLLITSGQRREMWFLTEDGLFLFFLNIFKLFLIIKNFYLFSHINIKFK